jgi:hypothetical protein
MSHYIADLIKRAEAAESLERDNLERECAGEILRLWNQRHNFHNPERPLASFDSIYRALDRLDPENSRWSYFRIFGGNDAPTAADVEINGLLSAALEIDEAARDAVRELIVGALGMASQREAKWLDLARKIRDDESDVLRSLRRLHRAYSGDAVAPPVGQSADDSAIRAIEALSDACQAAREAAQLHRQ